MGKPSKTKKEKVPKITEKQYAEYLSSLSAADNAPPQRTGENEREDGTELQ